MTRERAKWMDQRSCWVVKEAGTLGKWRRPPTASPEPDRMIAFAPFQGFIWAMSVNICSEGCATPWWGFRSLP